MAAVAARLRCLAWTRVTACAPSAGRTLHVHKALSSDQSLCRARAYAASSQTPGEQQTVAVVGFGLIGRSWAILFARAGYNVNCFDARPLDPEKTKQALEESCKDLQKQDLLNGQSVDEVVSRCVVAADLASALSGAQYCQESIFEDAEVKRKLYLELGKVAPADCILASSTSCIDPKEFSEGMGDSRRQVLVAHPVSPPHLIPLVELLPAPWTDPALVGKAKTLLKGIGQAPIVLNKPVFGFALNRLQWILLAEAVVLVQEGVISPDDIDTVIESGLGLRWSFMGPFEVGDCNGPAGVGDYFKAFGDSITRIAQESRDGPMPDIEKCKATVDPVWRARLPTKDELDKKRFWRDRQLAALGKHKAAMASKDPRPHLQA